MLSSRPPIAVFDLDGTLADTAPDLIATLNIVLAGQGLPPVAEDSGREMIGAGARAMIERGLSSNSREATPALLDELFLAFIAHYGRHLCVHTRLFAGVEAALDRLKEDGFALAVCTNKIEAHSIAVLKGLGIADRFRAICGRDTFRYFKPDPRHLSLTIERAGGDMAGSVMVGDSRTDIATAKAAGVPVVAVTFGYTDTPVAELDPDAVVDSYDALPQAVRRVTGRNRPGGGGRDRD